MSSTILQFIEQVNKDRRKASTGWYRVCGKVQGVGYVSIKAYKTWAQKIEIRTIHPVTGFLRNNAIQYSLPSDISVREFTGHLQALLENVTKQNEEERLDYEAEAYEENMMGLRECVEEVEEWEL
jgi:hypothetical protein